MNVEPSSKKNPDSASPNAPTKEDWCRWWDEDDSDSLDEDDEDALAAEIGGTAMEFLLAKGTMPSSEFDCCLILNFCVEHNKQTLMREFKRHSKVALDSFEFRGADWQHPEAVALFVELFIKPRCQQIKAFWIKQSRLHRETLHALCEGLRLCTALEDVFFEKCDLDEEDAMTLWQSLEASRQTLQTLSLGGNSVGDRVACTIADQLKSLPALKLLHLKKCTLGEATALALGKALRLPHPLGQLDLSENALGDRGGAVIFTALQDNVSMTHLAMVDCALQRESVHALTSLFNSNTQLEVLDLSDNALSTLPASFGNALRKQKTLRILAMAASVPSDDSIAMIFEALQFNSILTALNVANLRFTANSVKALVSFLEHSKLEKLNLSYCKLQDKDCELLMRALLKNSSLRWLDLPGNNMGLKACTAAAVLLKSNKTLLSLQLASCSIDDNGLAAFCAGLAGKTMLQKLDLSNNLFGSTGLQSLQRALAVNTGLISLCVQSKHLPADAVRRQFEELLKKNATLANLDYSNLLLSHEENWSTIERHLQVNARLSNLGIQRYLLELARNFAYVTLSFSDVGKSIWEALRDAPDLDGELVRLRSALRLSEVSRTVKFGPPKISEFDAVQRTAEKRDDEKAASH